MPLFCAARRPSIFLPSRFSFLIVPLALIALIAALHGCGGEAPSTPFAPTARRAEAAPVVCPNADLAASRTLVHVDAAGEDSDSCGDSQAAPCASIGAGIARCAVAGCAVVVRHGLYPTTASIALRDAVSVHGSCRFADEPERHYRTVVAAAPPAGAPAIDASGINSATELTGIVVLGKNETAPGEASIAMRVAASRGLTLAGVTLASGRGGDGAAGAGSMGGPGGAGVTPGSLFALGGGGQACPSSPPGSGGSGGMGRDANQFTIQGAACGPDCLCAQSASRVAPAQLAGQASGRARGGGSGGVGAFGGNCAGKPSLDPTPGDGGPGMAGEVGDCSLLGGKAAAGAASAGSFAAGRWLAGRGGPGGAGGAGSGGGGGGAGGYATFVPFIGDIESYYGFGGGGGGGGGGGCGGPGGSGGQQGGASIPLVLIDASIAGLSAGSNLIPGPGGHGGAGGNGGPSFGIALVGNSPDPGHEAVYPGAPGAAGSRGAGGANPAAPGDINSLCRSADGEDGQPGGSASVTRFGEQS